MSETCWLNLCWTFGSDQLRKFSAATDPVPKLDTPSHAFTARLGLTPTKYTQILWQLQAYISMIQHPNDIFKAWSPLGFIWLEQLSRKERTSRCRNRTHQPKWPSACYCIFWNTECAFFQHSWKTVPDIYSRAGIEVDTQDIQTMCTVHCRPSWSLLPSASACWQNQQALNGARYWRSHGRPTELMRLASDILTS